VTARPEKLRTERLACRLADAVPPAGPPATVPAGVPLRVLAGELALVERDGSAGALILRFLFRITASR
jgi:hypothetical protein